MHREPEISKTDPSAVVVVAELLVRCWCRHALTLSTCCFVSGLQHIRWCVGRFGSRLAETRLGQEDRVSPDW